MAFDRYVFIKGLHRRKLARSRCGRVIPHIREIEEIRAEGYAKGRANGYAKEYAEEYAEGYVEGYTEGYALEEKKEMANRLNDFGLPVEQIAQALNADVPMVQEWLAEPQLPKEQ